MNIDQIVQRFKFLDLTEYQARVLYALLKNKSCSISDIAKVSNVPNTRVYDVVKQLMGMDYVLQISDKPKLYRVRNVDLILDSLISKKELQFTQIKTEMKEFKSFFKDENPKESSKLVKVEKELDLVKVLNEELGSASKTIVGFGGKELTHHSLKNTLAKAISNNVNVKLVAHQDVANELSNAGMGEIKPFDHKMSAYLVDDNKLIVRLGNHDAETHHMTVQSDNTDLKNMLKTYFNYCWQDNTKN